jgi:glutamate--cysteine ligase
MDARKVRRQVGRLFPAARGERSSRVAVEHELLVADAATGATVPLDRVREAVAGSALAPYSGFEPGGQLELSLPCAASPDALAGDVRRGLADLRRDCSAAGIRLDATPVDPRTDVPLVLTQPRYLAMQAHFDRIGPAGRVMMRRTASTQACLDWWPGRAGLEQWRLLNLAGPFLAAAFARSSGQLLGSGSRLATWLAVDPTRTAFDGRLLGDDDPVAAYASFAASAAVFAPSGTVAEHLTTLFPPVRPRGRYLEVRFADVQPDDGIATLVSVLAALVYDDTCRSLALRRLAGEAGRLDRRWVEAATGSPEVLAVGRELVALTGAHVLDRSLEGAA